MLISPHNSHTPFTHEVTRTHAPIFVFMRGVTHHPYKTIHVVKKPVTVQEGSTSLGSTPSTRCRGQPTPSTGSRPSHKEAERSGEAGVLAPQILPGHDGDDTPNVVPNVVPNAATVVTTIGTCAHVQQQREMHHKLRQADVSCLVSSLIHRHHRQVLCAAVAKCLHLSHQGTV